jgi:hypothetical protein
MLKFKMRNALAFSVACCLVTLTGFGTRVPSLVTPSTAVLLPGQTLQFKVADSPQRRAVNGVVGGSPSAGTITGGGLYTASISASGKRMDIAVKGRSDSATVTRCRHQCLSH